VNGASAPAAQARAVRILRIVVTVLLVLIATPFALAIFVARHGSGSR
jgi:hypothetical protein